MGSLFNLLAAFAQRERHRLLRDYRYGTTTGTEERFISFGNVAAIGELGPYFGLHFVRKSDEPLCETLAIDAAITLF